MTENTQKLQVHNNQQASRFEVPLADDQFAFIDYRKSNGVYNFLHTEVPDAFEGQGVASQLTQGALEQVRAEGARLIPSCPYTRTYLKRHPEYQTLAVSVPEN